MQDTFFKIIIHVLYTEKEQLIVMPEDFEVDVNPKWPNGIALNMLRSNDGSFSHKSLKVGR